MHGLPLCSIQTQHTNNKVAGDEDDTKDNGDWHGTALV